MGLNVVISFSCIPSPKTTSDSTEVASFPVTMLAKVLLLNQGVGHTLEWGQVWF